MLAMKRRRVADCLGAAALYFCGWSCPMFRVVRRRRTIRARLSSIESFKLHSAASSVFTTCSSTKAVCLAQPTVKIGIKERGIFTSKHSRKWRCPWTCR